MITEPTVTVWGKTVTTLEFETFIGLSDEDTANLDPRTPIDADLLATGAGKICYTTKPNWRNPSTNTIEKYIKNILQLQHYSVLAHASIVLYVEGVSRALTHELIRSRFLGFSQLSQRYCDSSEMDWVCPPLALDDKFAQNIMSMNFKDSLADYDNLTDHFMEKHADKYDAHMLKKRAREAARGVLPNITETKLVVSGNLRAWRDFLVQRLDKSADLEIMRLGSVILEIIHDYAPISVSDLYEEFS